MSKGSKKWVKRISLICLLPVLLMLVVSILLYVPSVQNFVVRKLSRSISESLGMQIEIGHVHLSYPLDLKAQKIVVRDSAQDTLLFVGNLAVKVQPLPLLNKEVWLSSAQIADVKVDTKQLMDGMVIGGSIDKFSTNGDKIHLAKEDALLNQLTVSGANIVLRIDSLSPSDTADTKILWKIRANQIRLQQATLALQMPQDTLFVSSYIEEALLTNGLVDLGNERYVVDQFSIFESSLGCDMGNQPRAQGLDLSHLALSQINAKFDSLFFQGTDMGAHIQKLSFNEQSGLSIVSLQGKLQSDSVACLVPFCSIETLRSKLEMQASVPWSSIEKYPSGELRAQVQASIDRNELLTVMKNFIPPIEQYYPDTMLSFATSVEGNLDKLNIDRMESTLSGCFQIEANGVLEHLMDPVNRSGEVSLMARAEGDKFLKKLLPELSHGRVNFPDSLRLDMQAALSKGEYQGDLKLSEIDGRVHLSGRYNAFRQDYAIDLKVDSLNPMRFLPQDSIFMLTASLRAEGRGTDFFADSTRTIINGEVTDLLYKNTPVSGVSFDGSFYNHQAQATLNSAYPFVKGSASLSGSVYKEKITGMLTVDMDSLDLYGLKVTEKPLNNTFQIFSEVETDLKKQHRLDVTLGNWEMALEKQKVQPKTLILHVNSEEDSTHVSFHAGDLGLTLVGDSDIQSLADRFSNIASAFEQQMKKDTIAYLQYLTPMFPNLYLQLEVGQDNPIYNYMLGNNTVFNHLALHASTSPIDGVNADGLLLELVKDTTKIDTVRLNVWQDSISGLQYTCDVVKNRFRRQEPFVATIKGVLQTGMASVDALYKNGKGETGFQIGLRATKQSEGFRITMFPENPIIAFLPFTVNNDNYIDFRNLQDISANLKLVGKENSSLWIHSMETDGKMDELSVEVSQINLDKVSRLSGIPAMEGLVNAAVRYVPMDKTFMIAAEAGVDNLIYQGGRVGELLMNGVYLPLENGKHQFDAHFFRDQAELSALTAVYNSSGNGRLGGSMHVNQLPLEMLNPFFEGTARMNGSLRGEMTLTGTDKGPLWNGFLRMDTACMYVTAAGTKLRFDDRKVEVKNSKINFNKYGIYATGNNPFVINGIIDIGKPMHETADLQLTANNMQLLDAKKTPESIVYGKMLVNMNTTLKGPLRTMSMRGNLRLLGGTNMTYVMLEDDLETQNNFTDLVTFTYFTDTLSRLRRQRLGAMGNRNAVQALTPIGGMDVLLTIRIDPVVRLKVDLNEDQSNRVELKGGGDLSFQYTSMGDMLLSGRYSLSDGLIRYNIPVIPLTDFSIKDGSYVEWSGDPMNPYLNISALSKLRSSVSFDGQSRMVDFNTGIQIKETLENMALQFILEAPNDASVQNQLTAMGEEERSKQAISLLVAGVYLAGEGTGTERIDVGAALSSLLQREINNMLGSLMGEVPFSFDVNTYDGTDGMGRRIDYLGRFYKGFWNDRLYTTLGLRYSTKDPVTGNKFYFDDVSLEYRLDTEGTRSVKVFSQKDYESLFEGEIRKTGLGMTFKRKVKRLVDLFNFSKQPAITKEEENEGALEDADSETEDKPQEKENDGEQETDKQMD